MNQTKSHQIFIIFLSREQSKWFELFDWIAQINFVLFFRLQILEDVEFVESHLQKMHETWNG